jgi:hypothetical protein
MLDKVPGLKTVSRTVRTAKAVTYLQITRRLRPLARQYRAIKRGTKFVAAPGKLVYRSAKGLGNKAMETGKGLHALSEAQRIGGKGNLGHAASQAISGARQVAGKVNLGFKQTKAEVKGAVQDGRKAPVAGKSTSRLPTRLQTPRTNLNKQEISHFLSLRAL